MKERNFGLDVLRASAILMVLAAHIISPVIGGWLSTTLAALGALGVEIFFVLSGYLIGGILLRDYLNDDFNIGWFWFKRWMRTLPPYFVFLGLNVIFFRQHDTNLWPYLFFVQHMVRPAAFFGESWSLSVEEFFYLGLPILLMLASFFIKKSSKIFLCIALLVIVYGLVVRFLFSLDFSISWYDLRKITAFRVDACMYGVLAAWCSLRWPKWTGYPVLGCIGLFVSGVFACVVPLNDSVLARTLLYSLVSFFCFCLMPFFSRKCPVGRGLVARSITGIALISYSLYLCNLLVLTLIQKHLAGLSVVYQMIYSWIGCFSIAILSYFIVECPSIWLRDRLVSSWWSNRYGLPDGFFKKYKFYKNNA